MASMAAYRAGFYSWYYYDYNYNYRRDLDKRYVSYALYPGVLIGVAILAAKEMYVYRKTCPYTLSKSLQADEVILQDSFPYQSGTHRHQGLSPPQGQLARRADGTPAIPTAISTNTGPTSALSTSVPTAIPTGSDAASATIPAGSSSALLANQSSRSSSKIILVATSR